MKFENDFTVQAPIEEVWTTLLDVERVAPCMPGAEVLERVGENAYKVGIRVKVGPISMQYRGQVEITERDDSAHQATMRAKAREARGQGTADASVVMTLAEHEQGAHATIATDLQMSGRAAAMGRGVLGDVAQKLIETFAGNLATMLSGRGAAAEAQPAEAAAAASPGEPAGAPSPGEPAGAPSPGEPAGAPSPGEPGGAASTEPVTTTPEPATAGAGGAGGAGGAPAGNGGPGETGSREPLPWPPPTAPRAPAPSGEPAPGAASAAPPPPPPKSAPSGNESLPVGEIAASVIAERLKNPRNLLLATGAVGLTFGAIGYALGRSR